MKKVDVTKVVQTFDGNGKVTGETVVKIGERILDDAGVELAHSVPVQEWRNGELVKVGEKFVTPVVRDGEGVVVAGGEDFDAAGAE